MDVLGLVAIFVSRPAFVDKNGRSVSAARFYVMVPEIHLFEVCNALCDKGFHAHIDESYWGKVG